MSSIILFVHFKRALIIHHYIGLFCCCCWTDSNLKLSEWSFVRWLTLWWLTCNRHQQNYSRLHTDANTITSSPIVNSIKQKFWKVVVTENVVRDYAVYSTCECRFFGKVCMPLLYPGGYCIILAVLQRCFIWVGLLAVSLLQKLAWCLLIPWKQILREDSFRSGLAQGHLDPVSKVHIIFSKRDLLYISEDQPRAITIVCKVLQISWITVTNYSIEGFSCLVLGV